MRTKLILATLLVFLFAGIGRAEEAKGSKIEKAVTAAKNFFSLNLSFRGDPSKQVGLIFHPRGFDSNPGCPPQCNPKMDQGCVDVIADPNCPPGFTFQGLGGGARSPDRRL